MTKSKRGANTVLKLVQSRLEPIYKDVEALKAEGKSPGAYLAVLDECVYQLRLEDRKARDSHEDSDGMATANPNISGRFMGNIPRYD